MKKLLSALFATVLLAAPAAAACWKCTSGYDFYGPLQWGSGCENVEGTGQAGKTGCPARIQCYSPQVPGTAGCPGNHYVTYSCSPNAGSACV